MNPENKYKYELITFDRKGNRVHHCFCSTLLGLLKCLNDTAVQLCETYQFETDGLFVKGKYEAVYSYVSNMVIRTTRASWRRKK